MNREKISVIVPIYNSTKYIDRCLESICSQTYENLEIILVEDCSTDNSYDICLNWTKRDKRIILKKNENNRGVSFSRNEGIKLSTGKFISFIDSDDYVAKDIYEKLMAYMQDQSIQLIAFSAYKVNESNKITEMMFENKKRAKIGIQKAKKMFFKNKKMGVGVWSKLYRSEIIKFNNICFLEGKTFEDALFNYDYICSCDENAMIINEPLYFYFTSEGSLSRKIVNKTILDVYDIQEDMYNRIEISLKNYAKVLISKNNLNLFRKCIQEYDSTDTTLFNEAKKHFFSSFLSAILNIHLDLKTKLLYIITMIKYIKIRNKVK